VSPGAFPEGIIHAVSRVVPPVQHHGHEDGLVHVLGSLDFNNAFNMVSRVRLMERVCVLCPSILEYTQVCYGTCAHIFVGQSMLVASLGVHQVDPLRPARFFALYSRCIHPPISLLPAGFPNPLNA
jgi:hypothetical protein